MVVRGQIRASRLVLCWLGRVSAARPPAWRIDAMAWTLIDRVARGSAAMLPLGLQDHFCAGWLNVRVSRPIADHELLITRAGTPTTVEFDGTS